MTLFGRDLTRLIDALIVLLLIVLAFLWLRPVLPWADWFVHKRLPALLGVSSGLIGALLFLLSHAADLSHVFGKKARQETQIESLFSSASSSSTPERSAQDPTPIETE